MEVKITSENFESEVIKSDIPALVDFWATWCGPCQMLGPILEELSEEFDGKVKVCKVNVDEEPALAARYGVSSIPTVLLVKDGNVANKFIGYRPIEEVRDFMKS